MLKEKDLKRQLMLDRVETKHLGLIQTVHHLQEFPYQLIAEWMCKADDDGLFSSHVRDNSKGHWARRKYDTLGRRKTLNTPKSPVYLPHGWLKATLSHIKLKPSVHRTAEKRHGYKMIVRKEGKRKILRWWWGKKDSEMSGGGESVKKKGELRSGDVQLQNIL